MGVLSIEIYYRIRCLFVWWLDLAIPTERVGGAKQQMECWGSSRSGEGTLWSSIALLIQSVDHSLSVRLIPPYKYTTNEQNRAQARLIRSRIT